MSTERIPAGKAARHTTTQAPVQRFAAPRAFADEMEAAQVHPGVLRPSAGGAPLPGAVRAKMEAAFGHDFGGVRVHQGGEAESIGAAAYARGTHLHFAAGRYQPHSEAGQRLIGHELAHVVQQRARRVAHPGGAVPVNDAPHLEREAEALGTLAARSESVPLAAPAGPAPVAHAGPIQPVWVTLQDGKVKNVWKKGDDASVDRKTHVWMEKDEYIRWKNAGKRTPSNKWTDPESGTSYYSPDNGVSFFTDKGHTTKAPGPLDSTKLWNRSRDDRTRADIGLYDIAPYNSAKNREVTGDNMEHDHVPSGESRIRAWRKHKNASFQIPIARNTSYLSGYGSEKAAYDDALAIEIRGKKHAEGNDHMDFSATWGGRQQNQDTVKLADGTSYTFQRPDVDAELTEVAFHRDMNTMLSQSPRTGDDAISQVGAYRKLHKVNVRKGVLNPSAPAFDISGDPLANKKGGGGLTYTQVKGETQGERTTGRLLFHTRARLATPGGSSPLAPVTTTLTQPAPTGGTVHATTPQPVAPQTSTQPVITQPASAQPVFAPSASMQQTGPSASPFHSQPTPFTQSLFAPQGLPSLPPIHTPHTPPFGHGAPQTYGKPSFPRPLLMPWQPNPYSGSLFHSGTQAPAMFHFGGPPRPSASQVLPPMNWNFNTFPAPLNQPAPQTGGGATMAPYGIRQARIPNRRVKALLGLFGGAAGLIGNAFKFKSGDHFGASTGASKNVWDMRKDYHPFRG